jgi:hypothetical protein
MPLANKHNQNKNYFPVPLKGKSPGKDRGNVELIITQLRGEYKLGLHRLWIPNKTITMKF